LFLGEIAYPTSADYDIDVDKGIMLNRNNQSQIRAIRTALQQRFTLIQGPPGKCYSHTNSRLYTLWGIKNCTFLIAKIT